MKDNEIQAVHDDDLQGLLQSLGVYDSIIDGKQQCVFCKKVITLDNLGAIIPANDEILLACDNPVCIQIMCDEGNRG